MNGRAYTRVEFSISVSMKQNEHMSLFCVSAVALYKLIRNQTVKPKGKSYSTFSYTMSLYSMHDLPWQS